MLLRPKPNVLEILSLGIGTFLVLRYAWLLDDAFVYFRYVDNWIFLKLGPVYNQGEFVEGYSSPLWLLILAGLRYLGINFWLAVQGVGLLTFFLFWLGLVAVNRRLAPQGRTVNFPLLYLASIYAVLCYFTSGLETPLVQVCAIAYALFILVPQHRLLQIIVAISPLIRQELLMPLGIALCWGWWKSRRFPLIPFLFSLAFVGGWLLFRVWYYADFFPNTFYLKDVVEIRQGFTYLNDTAGPYYVYWLVPLFFAIGVWLWRTKRPTEDLYFIERAMMLLCAAPVLLYVVKIGGDPRHYRYLAFPFCLALCATSGLVEAALQRLQARSLVAPCIGVGVITALLLAYPRQLLEHPFWLTEKQHRVDLINDASAARRHKDLLYASWSPKVNATVLEEYRSTVGEKFYRGIAPMWWCANAYKRFDLRVIHSLGLADAFLGRTNAKINRPAHRWGLLTMADDMAKIEQSASSIGVGMFREAVDAKRAPEWVERNLDTIEVIEKKVFNHHDLIENLRLAFAFPRKLVPYGVKAPKGHGGKASAQVDDSEDDK